MPNVETVQAAFEDLPPGGSYGLVYAATSLHWTNPDNRWPRVAAMLEPGGVFASVGGRTLLADPALLAAVNAAQAPILDSDEIPSPDGTPPEQAMQWPGTELQQSELFEDVQQFVHVLPQRFDADGLIAAGTEKTLQGGTVKISGDKSSGMMVNDAHVLCGNIPTGNATVFVIDKVLTPSS